jgi:hypothetical protein
VIDGSNNERTKKAGMCVNSCLHLASLILSLIWLVTHLDKSERKKPVCFTNARWLPISMKVKGTKAHPAASSPPAPATDCASDCRGGGDGATNAAHSFGGAAAITGAKGKCVRIAVVRCDVITGVKG